MFKSALIPCLAISMTLWGCDGEEPPPWPQEQAEEAVNSASLAISLGSPGAIAEVSGDVDMLQYEVECPLGGRVATRGERLATLNDGRIDTTTTVEIDVLGCSANGSTMNGNLRQTEHSIIDGTLLEFSGITQGMLSFSGALTGECWLDISWTLDVNDLQFILVGSACGQTIDMSMQLGDIGGWDPEKAESFAESALYFSDSAASDVRINYWDSSGTVAVDLTETMIVCSAGGSVHITGTMIQTVNFVGESYDLTIALSDCAGRFGSANGTIMYTQSEQFDDSSGHHTIEETLSGELYVDDDPYYPSAPCVLDVRRSWDTGTGHHTITGTACGYDIMTSY